jgi:Golgi SNAP receptor complex protein 1
MMSQGAGGQSWSQLRNQSRQLENDIESKLLSFNKLGKDTDRRSSSSAKDGDARFEGMSMELQQLMDRLEDVNAKMHEAVGASATPSLAHTLSRHTEILDDMRRDFNKTKRSIRETTGRSQLLSSVQKDIDSYRSAEAQRQDLYMKENQSTMNSMRGAEDAISIAIAAKEALVKQRGIFGDVQSRMSVLTEKFPQMKNLMTKIAYRKNRDQVILAGVISTCIILTLMYTVR